MDYRAAALQRSSWLLRLQQEYDRQPRALTPATIVELPEDEPEKAVIRRRPSELSVADTVRVFAAIDNPAANLAFKTNKKGKLYVRITEVKQES